MAIWNDLAQWRGPTPNVGGTRPRTLGLVLHIAEGSYEGTIGWGKNPSADVSYHFVIGEQGQIAQLVDTADIAWTQVDGNASWLSVEFEGHTGRSLTPAMVESTARLFARISKEYGVPLQISNAPSTPGLGHHSMGGYAWGGHFQCPGQPIIDQKPLILARAREILGGGVSASVPASMKGTKMYFVQLKGNPTVFLSNGMQSIGLSAATLADLKTVAAEGRVDIPKTDVRVVTNRGLLGVIIGNVPNGFTANP